MEINTEVLSRGGSQEQARSNQGRPGAARSSQESKNASKKFTVQNRTIKTSLKQGFVISKGGVLSRGGARSSQEQPGASQEQPGARRTPALLKPPPTVHRKTKKTVAKHLKVRCSGGGF